MIDPHEFAQKQLELTGEFGKYLIDHPEVDDRLPAESHIYFQIEGENEFNNYARALAEKQHCEEGRPIVCIRVKGLSPRQGSRLIDPVIAPVETTA